MLRLFAFALAISACFDSFSQTWQWACQASGGGDDAGMAIAQDAGGNIYVAGYFSSATIIFGSTTLTNSGSRDLFIAKYTPSGALMWVRQVTGGFDEQITGIAITGASVYVTGSYKTTITFGGFTLNNPTGWEEIFIVKYDTNGNVIWARKATGSKPDYSNTIAADASGNVYIAGYFYSDTLIFGTTQLLLSSQGSADSYFAKYDANGNVVWATKMSTGVMPKDLTVSPAGNIFMTGYFSHSNVTIAGISFSNPTGWDALFTIKISTSGNGVWGKSVDAVSLAMYPTGIVTDAAENVYVTGDYNNSSFNFASTTVTHVGADDVFLLKYDATGNEAWANSASSNSSEYSNSIAIDPGGNIFITGSFLMNGLTFGSYSISNAGAYDIFVAKYNSAGTVLSAFGSGGSGSEGVRDICVLGSAVVTTGAFSGSTVPFSSSILTNTQPGSNEMYVAKLGPTAGVQEEWATDDISIYPNPSAGQFSIIVTIPITGLEIRDCVGRVVRSVNLNSEQAEVKIGEVDNGVYFVRLRSEAGSLTRKIAVAK